MAGTSQPKHRISSIACPVQRVVASHIREIEDLFTQHFAGGDPEKVLVRPEGATEGPARIRNFMRMPVIGCVVRLGLDLGLSTHALHGRESGYTEIVELAGLHYQTTAKARALFDELISDRGEVGKMLAARYKAIRAAALDAAQGLVPVAPRRAQPQAVLPGPAAKRGRKGAGRKAA